ARPEREARAAALRLRRVGAPRAGAVRARDRRRRGRRVPDVHRAERRVRHDAAQAALSHPAARNAALGADRAGGAARGTGAAGEPRPVLFAGAEVEIPNSQLPTPKVPSIVRALGVGNWALGIARASPAIRGSCRERQHMKRTLVALAVVLAGCGSKASPTS